MATKKKILTEDLSLVALAELIYRYWRGHPGGLVWDSRTTSMHDFAPITNWLCAEEGVSATDQEILEAHKVLFRDLAKKKPSLRLPKLEHAGIDHPGCFRMFVNCSVIEEKMPYGITK